MLDLLFIFIVLGTNQKTELFYLLYGLVLIVFVVKFFLCNKILLIKPQVTDLFPFLLFGIWAYGFLVGIIKGNEIIFVFRNFAGMTIYLFYYVLLFKQTNFKRLTITIFWGSFALCLTTLFLILASFSPYLYESPLRILLFNSSSNIVGSSLGFKRIIFGGQISIAIIFTASLGFLFFPDGFKRIFFCKTGNCSSIFFNRGYTVQILILSVSVIALLIIPASRGYLLGSIFIFLMISFSQLLRFFKRFAFGKNHLVFLVLLSIFLGVFYMYGLQDLMVRMFDEKDLANISRYNQIDWLLADLDFFGNGLGATLPPGLESSTDKPYGFEANYINMFHKFGVMSVFILIVYFITLFKVFLFLLDKNNYFVGLIALGCMFYLIPGLGNPYLFAPQSVTLHCIALYFLRKKNNYGICNS
jgi:hypothetical protein